MPSINAGGVAFPDTELVLVDTSGDGRLFHTGSQYLIDKYGGSGGGGDVSRNNLIFQYSSSANAIAPNEGEVIFNTTNPNNINISTAS